MEEAPNGSRSRVKEEMIESLSFQMFYHCGTRPYTEQGKKMVEIVKNIASESEKCGYNPKKDTNWCDLPMEMREECIKRMDFETRTRMRSTEIERGFVDAHKYYFEKMHMQTRGSPTVPSETSISMVLTNRDPLSRGGMEMVIVNERNMNESLKNCEFGEIECFSFGGQDYSTHALEQCAPFRFKSLKSKGGNLHMVDFLLGRSEGDIEKIRLNVKYERDFSIGQFLRFPSFFRAKLVVVEFMALNNFSTDMKKMADKWSELDVEIGTECHFTTGKLETPIHGTHQKTSFYKMSNESKIIGITASINATTRQGELVASVNRKPAPVQAEVQGTR